jgi:predicted dithiol-disulfide oxidoreductase (DUF899 family)
MPEHRIATQEEWQAERDALLAEEKELTRRNDELARKRRELPWVPVEKDYRFETEHGTRSLAELFDGRSQLLVYHFMFGPPYARAARCARRSPTRSRRRPSICRRGTRPCCSRPRAAREALAYRERMGWPIEWVSSGGTDFNRDLGFLSTEEELKPFLESEIPPVVEQMAKASGTDVAGYVAEGPGLSAYVLASGNVYRTYVTTARGLEPAMAYYGLLDRTARGRQEEGSATTGSAATTSTSTARPRDRRARPRRGGTVDHRQAPLHDAWNRRRGRASLGVAGLVCPEGLSGVLLGLVS